MLKYNKHKFHLVSPSCLPIVTGFSALLLVSNIVFYWHTETQYLIFKVFDSYILHLSIFMFATSILAWLTMVVYESGNGFHTKIVRNGLRWGVILFIVSEIMFFFSIFWSFFHFSLSPSFYVGMRWPLVGVQNVSFYGLSFTNTALLLSSGITITFAHHYLKQRFYLHIPVDVWAKRDRNFGKNKNMAPNASFTLSKFISYLSKTIVLGLTFLFCQWVEYTYGLQFRWNDHVLGSVFFIATGFHGFHVLLGTFGLLFCLVRALFTRYNLNWFDSLLFIFKRWNSPFYFFFQQFRFYASSFQFTASHHVGFEAALWYWHFVDVVWIFLYLSVYWWGSFSCDYVQWADDVLFKYCLYDPLSPKWIKRHVLSGREPKIFPITYENLMADFGPYTSYNEYRDSIRYPTK